MYFTKTKALYYRSTLSYFQPSVALPNSRRSPSTELRPAMAPVAGMYPTMMIPGKPAYSITKSDKILKTKKHFSCSTAHARTSSESQLQRPPATLNT